MKFTVLFLLLLFTAEVHAATYYVSKAGLDSHGCSTTDSAATNKLTIAAGIACLSPGDTLTIHAGTYSENLGNDWSGYPHGSPGGSTTIQGFSGETVTLGYVDVGNGVPQPHDWLLNNLTFNATLTGSNTGKNAFYTGSATRFTVSNSIIKNGPTMCIQGSGDAMFTHVEIFGCGQDNQPHFDYGAYVWGDGMIFDHINMHDVHGYGFHIYNSGHNDVSNNTIRYSTIGPNVGGTESINAAIILSSGSNNKAHNNLIYNNNRGVQFSNCDNCAVYNNTIYNNVIIDKTPWYGVEIGSGTTNAKVQNNIILGSGINGITNSGTSSTIGNNFCDSAATGCNQTGNPNFVSTTVGNANFLKLSTGSTAIGAGADVSSGIGCTASVNCLDYGGTVRPQNSTWDIGAYEFASGTLPVVTINQPAGCTGTSTACTTTTSTVNLSGSTTQSGGTVAWVNDRGGSGSAAASGSWTFLGIVLKAGINNITVTGTDGTGNSGFDAIALTYAPTFPGDAMVLALGFEDGSGTTATDSSGSNTATLVNTPTWVTTGRFGKALQFNGINQFVRVTDSNSLRLTQSFTLSAWVQPSVSSTTFKAVIYKEGGTLASPYQLYGVTSSFGGCTAGGYAGLVTVNGANGPTYSACNSLPLQTGVWTHIAVTYDNATGQLKLYRQGVLVLATTASGYMEPSTVTSPLDLRIGGSEFGENWQGLIDEVRVYNKALPITAASNTVAGAACTSVNFSDNTAVATASIVGNMNCPIINLTPPSQFKLSAGATELKLGTSATAAKIGANP